MDSSQFLSQNLMTWNCMLEERFTEVMLISSVDCNMKAEVTSSFSFLARFNVDAHYLLSRFRWYFFLFRMTKGSYFLSLGG